MNTPTHPPSATSTRSHVEAFRRFAPDLRAALKGAFPSGKKPYSRVVVLLFSWANDDMGVGVLEKELAEVFKDTYGYQTEHFQIPATSTQDAQWAMNRRINQFISDWDGHGCLLIYVYSGHASSVGTNIILR